jgi:telomere length regulation protein
LDPEASIEETRRGKYKLDMADFLTAVSTKKVKAPEPLLQQVKNLKIQNVVEIDSTKSLLDALKSQPSQETVTNALIYMTSDGFSLLLPDPLNASIAHQLVNDTIPHYWRPLHKSPQARQFCRILRNPTGIGHMITRLRSLISDTRQKKAPGEERDSAIHVEDLLDVLEGTLKEDDTSIKVLQDVQKNGKSAMQKKLIWREYLSQIASGRIVSIVAEAEDATKAQSTSRSSSWLADGSKFAAWLGRNIAYLMRETEQNDEAVVEICSKALTLGYTGTLNISEATSPY